MPKVSVIIPTYNCAQYITESIDSVLNQTYKDYEIIVVDDGSTDNIKEILVTYTSKIKYIYQENSGPSKARNTGILNSNGQYIAFLDADDIWEPTKLEKQLPLFERDHMTSLVFCFTKHVDINGNVFFIDEYDSGWKGYAANRLLLRPLATSSVLIKKNNLQKVGVFDEKLLFSEDNDLFLRIAARFRFNFVSEALIKKRVHNQNLTGDETKFTRIINDQIRVLDKFYSNNGNKHNYKMKRKAYFEAYRKIGYMYLKVNKLALSRQCFIKSLLYNFLSKESYYQILKTLMGNKMYLSIKKVKSKYLMSGHINE